MTWKEILFALYVGLCITISTYYFITRRIRKGMNMAMNSNGPTAKTIGLYNEGDVTITSVDGKTVITDGSTGGGVLQRYNAKTGTMKITETRQQTWLGTTPPADKSGQATEPKRTDQPLATISLPIRLLSLKEKIDLRFPTSSQGQEIVDNIFKDKGIHVELRQKINGEEKTLDPTKTLSQENVTSGTELLAYEVQVVTQQSNASSMCSSKGTSI